MQIRVMKDKSVNGWPMLLFPMKELTFVCSDSSGVSRVIFKSINMTHETHFEMENIKTSFFSSPYKHTSAVINDRLKP